MDGNFSDRVEINWCSSWLLIMRVRYIFLLRKYIIYLFSIIRLICLIWLLCFHVELIFISKELPRNSELASFWLDGCLYRLIFLWKRIRFSWLWSMIWNFLLLLLHYWGFNLLWFLLLLISTIINTKWNMSRKKYLLRSWFLIIVWIYRLLKDIWSWSRGELSLILCLLRLEFSMRLKLMLK